MPAPDSYLAAEVLQNPIGMQVNRSTTPWPFYPIPPTPRELVQALIAQDNGDDRALQKLLHDGRASIHDADPKGNGTLHLAVSMGASARVVRALVKAGADPAVVDLRGNTALHLLVCRTDGKPEIVSELLSGGGLALADQPDGRRRTALELARQHGTAEMVDWLIGDIHLLERCATWRQDANGAAWGDLVDALDNAPLDEVQDQIDSLGGVNATDPRGMPVLVRAAEACRDDVVDWLLREGARPDAVYRSPRTGIACTALMAALPYPAITRLLLAWGANPMQTYCEAASWWSRPQTALHVAAMNGAAESMTALLNARQRKEWRDADLRAALMTALRENRPQVASALLEYSGRLDTATMRDALLLAARLGHREPADRMLAIAPDAYVNRQFLREARYAAWARNDNYMGSKLSLMKVTAASKSLKGNGDTCAVQ